MINLNTLAEIKVKFVVPTFEEVTMDREIIIFLKDGSVQVIINDGGFTEEEEYKSKEEYLKYINFDSEEFEATFEKDLQLTDLLRIHFDEVEELYLGYL